MPRKVIAYIDGYNLYYGMRAANLRHYLWLDLPKLIRGVLLPDQTLIETKYFTSRIVTPAESVARQTAYIEALETLPGLRLREGRYDGETNPCENCGHPHTKHSEKMTDVNIATSIVRDAHMNLFDTAVLVTGDADQVPAVELVRDVFREKRVVVCFPPKRVSKHLGNTAHVRLNINETMLRAAQLPDTVTKRGGIVLSRPAKWAVIA